MDLCEEIHAHPPIFMNIEHRINSLMELRSKIIVRKYLDDMNLSR